MQLIDTNTDSAIEILLQKKWTITTKVYKNNCYSKDLAMYVECYEVLKTWMGILGSSWQTIKVEFRENKNVFYIRYKA